MATLDSQQLSLLRAVAPRFPTIAAAAARIAHLRGVLSLPMGTVHVVSDVHGEHVKLQHIINNASGSLRPLVEQLFGARLSDEQRQELLNTVYYPKQMFEHLGLAAAAAFTRAEFMQRMLGWQFEIIAALMERYSVAFVVRTFPPEYANVFSELLWATRAPHRSSYVRSLLDALVEQRRDLDAVRRASRVIRNLCVYELVVAGDLGDRGPRIDRVIDVLMRQPRVSLCWGNHDVNWLGACLGHRALIATVVRVSLRYRRVAQLEEGYGISLRPLESLVRRVYASDPAERFRPKGDSFHDTDELARMQKAIAIIQFKLESQLIARRPEYDMAHRSLMDQLDLDRGTVRIDGADYPLRDTALPTVDPDDPTALSADEHACVEQLRRSFLESPAMWEQMQFVARAGAMYLVRGEHLIFHGCVPVDDDGELLALEVDGTPRAGRALFDQLGLVVHRAVRERRQEDLDMLWYLWTGPRSPLFGKDKMTTFERHLVADKATHSERKNPYFRLLHERTFCARVLREMGVVPEGMIVNGHVPVKPERGEDPVKGSHKAITIDGAFSQAYGDRGYTLILAPDATRLAEHHHFASVADALEHGADILPAVRELTRHDSPRLVADSDVGDELRADIHTLEQLIEAYHTNALPEQA